jgi:hypothetical protein
MIRLMRHRRSLASLAATLFVAVWASMAVAPCLMAAEALVAGDCPHCPEPPPCHDDGGAGGCTWLDGYDFDGRQPSLPRVDIQLVALPVAVAADLPERAFTTRVSAAPRASPDPVGPRLHLRNCVLND